MKEETREVDKFEYIKTPVKKEIQTFYIAEDGTEFTNKNVCKAHEELIRAKIDCEHLLFKDSIETNTLVDLAINYIYQIDEANLLGIYYYNPTDIKHVEHSFKIYLQSLKIDSWNLLKPLDKNKIYIIHYNTEYQDNDGDLQFCNNTKFVSEDTLIFELKNILNDLNAYFDEQGNN